ncbi:MAG: FHA domain-containing protein [Bdellovibrionales bacterium]
MSAAPAIKSRVQYKLKIVAGPHLNEVYGLDQDLLRIGRGEDNDIRLVNDGRVSRHHIKIVWTGTEYRFTNLSQKNFVMLDGQILQEGALRAASKLQVGETLIEVFEAGPVLVSTEPAGASMMPAPLQPPAPLAAKPQGPPVGLATPAARPAPAPAPARPNPGASSARPAAPRPYRTSQQKGRNNFYYIIGGVVLLMVFLLLQDSKPKVKKTFRPPQQVEYDLLQSSNEKKKLEERREALQTETAKRVQENIIKGFRDYQQGNFARARDHFQVVLNLDPDHEMAKRYYHLSRVKFDEMLQFHMLQGLRYKDKRNYRMCRSSFQSALIMIQNNSNHPKYREIKQFFDECTLASEGRF